MLVQLLTSDDGLIAVAATAVGLLLPLGFHLFIRRKVRESRPARTGVARPVGSPADD